MPLIPPQRFARAVRILELRARLVRIQRREQAVMLALLAEMEQEREERRRERRPRSMWVRPWLARRPLLGHYDRLMQELMRESATDFKGYMRMEPDMFRELLVRVGPHITKSDQARPPLEPGLKLAVTLRFLATGESYHSLSYQFRVAHNTISLFVPEVCEAIREEYLAEQFTTPSDPQGWMEVERTFAAKWNWHHCCGALDGKHVRIVKPKHSGSNYYCHKGFYSIIILGLVDGDYKFVWCDVGTPGSESDAGVFKISTLEPALREGTLGLPDPAPLPGDDRDTPFFMVGDDAFPLRPYMMKPYSDKYLDHDQMIFNYRCSRGRRVVENAFGILASRWRVLHTPMNVSSSPKMFHHLMSFFTYLTLYFNVCLCCMFQVTPENATTITKATIILHNIMRDRYPNAQNLELEAPEGDAGSWRAAGVLDAVHMEGRGPRQTRAGKEQRAYLKAYYCSPVGAVPWQETALDAPAQWR